MKERWLPRTLGTVLRDGRRHLHVDSLKILASPRSLGCDSVDSVCSFIHQVFHARHSGHFSPLLQSGLSAGEAS